mmetsp:Transcript_14468/g.21996  ORF Transcript_14468/g.21996 Transcript_14468/m.21996 type:complete len:510 (-) Transcript_14468:53-1582(-)
MALELKNALPRTLRGQSTPLPITTPPSGADTDGKLIQNGRKSHFPQMKRQQSAPAMPTRKDILHAYNYKETEFDKEHKSHRKIRLERILVDMGYHPNDIANMISSIETNSVEGALEKLLDSQANKKLKMDESKLKDSETEEELKMLRNKRLRSELFAAVAVISKKGKIEEEEGEALPMNAEMLRKVMPKLQKVISTEIIATAEKRNYAAYLQYSKEDKKEVKIEKKEEMRQCGICLEEQPKSAFVDASCKHYFCKTCWSRYLEVEIQNGKVLQIPCPEYKCNRKVSQEEIKKSVNDSTYIKYLKFKRNREIAADSNKRWCITPDCPGILTKVPLRRKATCNVCDQSLCWHCGEPYHKGSCEKAAADSKDDAYRRYKRLHNVKLCPNCKATIEKNSGCNHMTCAVCKYEFCWICGSKYTKRHYAPYNIVGCPGQQDGDCACFGDDNCCCLQCGCCTMDFECCDRQCSFNPVGFTKRFFSRLACMVIMVPCCPCLALIVVEEECSDCCDGD